MVLTVALRFVPTLFNEVDKILKAQRARGAALRSRSPWRLLGARHRTHLYHLRLTHQDMVASLVVLLVSLVGIHYQTLSTR